MAQTKAQLLGPVVGDVVMDVSTLSLDSEGNKVGIGTTEADLTLHVNGVNALPSTSGSTPTGHLTLRSKSTSSSHGMFMGVSNASPWSSWIQAQDVTNNATNYPLLLNPNGGNIGINQTNPTRKLHITTASGSDTAGSTDSHLLFDVADDSGPGWVQRVYDSGAGSGGQDGSFALDRFYNGSWVNTVTIKRDTGRVGLGTTDPISELMVENATQSHITVKTSGSNMAKFGSKGNDVYIGGTAGAANIIFKRNIVSTDHPADSGIETLHITSNGILQLDNGNQITAADTTTYIGLGGGNSTSNGANMFLYGGSHSTNASSFVFRTNTTERLRIASSGYVGMNLDANVSGNATVTPWTNLHVVGSNVADGVAARNNATPTGQLHVSSSGFGINQGGTISLGSEADNVNPNAAYASISGRRVSSLGYQYGGYLTLNVSDGTTLDEKVRITSDGKLGINITNPTRQLEIYNSSHATAALKSDTQSSLFFSDDDTNIGQISYMHSDNYMYFRVNDAERLRITSDGHMTMGVPNYSFNNAKGFDTYLGMAFNQYDGGILMTSSSGLYAGEWSFGLEASASHTHFVILDDANERLRITSDGQVNIGGDFTQTGFTANITRNSSETDILRIKGNGGNAFIRFQDSDSSSNYTLGADDAVGGGGFVLYDRNASAYRLIIDDSGRILKGMNSSLLGSSDVQLTGSGGPAKIAGYKSDNNPTANNSMLTVTGYSQSGGTFTGIGEIDFRVDQGSNTASGYHPGSIVTRVNGGSTTGTHAGLSYSYAGLKDRERIAFKSKRYYSLPEWQSGDDTYNTFREEWDYQHYVGYNQYSWYRFTHHSGSSSRGGSVDIRVTWSTRHASGNGYGHWAFHWRENHGTGYMEIGNVYRYHLNYLSGSYYGWASNPDLDVYEINDNGNVAGFYLRVQGHVQANSSTYDGGAMHQFLISAHTNRTGSDVNKFEFVGNSTPSDVGSIQGNVNLP